MSKKVRYAVGALGAVPALGLLTAPTTAAAGTVAHPQKTVRTASPHDRRGVLPNANCVASKSHTKNANGLHLKFWTKGEGSRICIGTIEVTGGGFSTGESVNNNNGDFCGYQVPERSVTFVCRDIFAEPGLLVYGYAVNSLGQRSRVIDSPYSKFKS